MSCFQREKMPFRGRKMRREEEEEDTRTSVCQIQILERRKKIRRPWKKATLVSAPLLFGRVIEGSDRRDREGGGGCWMNRRFPAKMANDVCPALQLEEGGTTAVSRKIIAKRIERMAFLHRAQNSSSSAVMAFAKTHLLTFRAAHARAGEQAVEF